MAKQGEYVKELTLTRIFDAPRARVWKAWTDPKLVAKWWGPQGFTIPVCEIDARPGGALLIHMSGFGMLAPMSGVFREVVEPERLVFTNNAFFEVPPVTPVIEGITTVTFTEMGNKTKVTVHNAILKAAPGAAQALEGMEPGWNQQLDKLAEFLR
jgi:uncharacterized protein YndB with AHSA1/START domain